MIYFWWDEEKTIVSSIDNRIFCKVCIIISSKTKQILPSKKWAHMTENQYQFNLTLFRNFSTCYLAVKQPFQRKTEKPPHSSDKPVIIPRRTRELLHRSFSFFVEESRLVQWSALSPPRIWTNHSTKTLNIWTWFRVILDYVDSNNGDVYFVHHCEWVAILEHNK